MDRYTNYFTKSQTILVVIYRSFQYLNKQVKIEEKFKAFVTADSFY